MARIGSTPKLSKKRSSRAVRAVGGGAVLRVAAANRSADLVGLAEGFVGAMVEEVSDRVDGLVRLL